MSALEDARATTQAKIDNALDAMPPKSRERTEIYVQVPIAALRTLLAATAPPTDEWEYGTVAEAFGGEPEPCGTLTAAEHVRDNSETLYKKWTHGSKVTVYRRRKASPWQPVPDEGAAS